MRIVLDSSALLASLLDEPGVEEVDAVIDDAIVSSVNIAEVVERLAREDNPAAMVRAIVDALPCAIAVPETDVAVDAGLLRAATRPAGLSLGDRFCLALARKLAAPVLTADRTWSSVADAVGVEVRLIR
jgi:PIN domain nuclease of toxin-antitoxin system